ncbi:hypothetical protein [Chryseobacterium sp. RLHN22]|uniref:hypothetical protein n=1 Tax=Chryseobacterium sp. RLHN22 TaxID=3437885 RepID=UPI003D9AB6E5
MEINSAFIIGWLFATYMFLFCIIPYYINNIFFKNDVKGVSMFMHFGKPLYSYTLKSGVKVDFGYLPSGSSISFRSEDDFEDKEAFKYNVKRARYLGVIFTTIIVLTLFSVTLILGENPVKICKEILILEYDLITKKFNSKSVVPIVSDYYKMYGRLFFLCFFVVVQMIISVILNLIFSLWEYLGLIGMAVLIFLYFFYDLTYFMFPLSFYIDILLSMTISGFLYFLLLRFFIK